MLQAARDASRSVDEREVVRLFGSACAAIAHLHSQAKPVAHRDIKVENLLIASDKKVKLCDFGSCTTRAKVYKSAKVRRGNLQLSSDHRTLATILNLLYVRVCATIGILAGDCKGGGGG